MCNQHVKTLLALLGAKPLKWFSNLPHPQAPTVRTQLATQGVQTCVDVTRPLLNAANIGAPVRPILLVPAICLWSGTGVEASVVSPRALSQGRTAENALSAEGALMPGSCCCGVLWACLLWISLTYCCALSGILPFLCGWLLACKNHKVQSSIKKVAVARPNGKNHQEHSSQAFKQLPNGMPDRLPLQDQRMKNIDKNPVKRGRNYPMACQKDCRCKVKGSKTSKSNTF